MDGVRVADVPDTGAVVGDRIGKHLRTIAPVVFDEVTGYDVESQPQASR
jgi:hypothetical protein